MKLIYQTGSQKEFSKLVEEADAAKFDTGAVHPVYSTFALGRDAEWCCRLFVLEMKEDFEEGIGTFLKIEHVSPALLGSTVNFVATVSKIERNEITCTFEARVGSRLIAKGEQGQKIINKEKLETLFNNLSSPIG